MPSQKEFHTSSLVSRPSTVIGNPLAIGTASLLRTSLPLSATEIQALSAYSLSLKRRFLGSWRCARLPDYPAGLSLGPTDISETVETTVLYCGLTIGITSSCLTAPQFAHASGGGGQTDHQAPRQPTTLPPHKLQVPMRRSTILLSGPVACLYCPDCARSRPLAHPI